MSVHATVTLDSGIFITKKVPNEPPYSGVGYFQCNGTSQDGTLCPDIRVYADGEEVKLEKPIKLGNNNCRIYVQHMKADGTMHNAMTTSKSFATHLLKVKDLYGKEVPLRSAEFDCIIKFRSGHFCGSMVKNRKFKRINKANHLEEQTLRPIAHNVVIHYDLAEGETLQFVRDNDQVIFSSKEVEPKSHLEIEIMADNTTAERFFCKTIGISSDEVHWLPNQGDPPPAEWP